VSKITIQFQNAFISKNDASQPFCPSTQTEKTQHESKDSTKPIQNKVETAILFFIWMSARAG
jgi:hypothetical protein